MSILINFILYFLFFAVVHSLLAMDHTKERAKKMIGKRYRYYRLIYTLISIILLIPVLIIWLRYSSLTPVVYQIPAVLYPFIIMIRLAAIGIFGYAVLQKDILEFIGLKREVKKSLTTEGAYRIVRHPLYTAGILLLATNMRMNLLDLTMTLLVTGYFLVGALIEEKRLIGIFGEEYRNYQKQVSMIFPVKWLMKKLGFNSI